MAATTSTILTSKAIDIALKSVKPFYNSIKRDYSFSIHNSKLIHSLHNIGKVKTLFFGANQPVELDDFFINPNIQLEYRNKKTIRKIKSLKDLHQNNDASQPNILITGTVGQGKSIFMRYLALQELAYGKIPLFIEFKYINAKNTLEKLVDEVFHNWLEQASKDNIKSLLNSGNITLFLDAFDELSTEHITDTMQAIDMYCRDFPNLQIIISSRPDHNISQHPQFKTISLLPYELKEQKALIDKLVTDEESRHTLHQQVEESNTYIQEVLITPLMVGLFIQKYLRNFSTPQNMVDFYQDIFDVVTDKHNKTKTGFVAQSKSGLNNSDLEKIFARFCFETARKSILVFDRKIYLEVLEFAISKSSLSTKTTSNTKLIAEDFEKYVCFILNDGDQYTFIHRSIQEFYTAKFLAQLPEKNITTGIQALKRTIQSAIFEFLELSNEYFFHKFYLHSLLLNIQKEFDINENYSKFEEGIFHNLKFCLTIIKNTETNDSKEKYLLHFSIDFQDLDILWIFSNHHSLNILKILFEHTQEECMHFSMQTLSKYSNIIEDFSFNTRTFSEKEFNNLHPEMTISFQTWKQNLLKSLIKSKILLKFHHLFHGTLSKCEQIIHDKENEINDGDLDF